jgi:hypothetical protein
MNASQPAAGHGAGIKPPPRRLYQFRTKVSKTARDAALKSAE